jgi:serine/threonine-protein kinase
MDEVPEVSTDPVRWRRVEELYHAALTRPIEARAVFLAEMCGNDVELRHEVEALLAQTTSSDQFLGEPALAVAAQLISSSDGTRLIGRRLGVYQIQTLLGAGGMGEVYRARDSRLGRDVALKILPDTFTHDPERLSRFRREAQVLAALNDPHIGAIYGLDEANGAQFLVLELVDGESLDKRIARGPIPVDEALGIATQIAEALEVAHEKGIIHRDLKPANIALTKDGGVKLLDFGLAKATEAASATSADLANSPTITSPAMMTGIGVILGTAAYMSPEQAKGRLADKRSDVWAFGCVVFEMLTGRRAFEGADVSDTLAAVLRAELNWAALPAATPTSIRKLLRRCLEKDPRERLHDIADARIEIREEQSEPRADLAGASAIAPPRPSTLRLVAPYLAAVLAALATGLVVWRVSRPAEISRPLVRFSIDLPDQTQLSPLTRDAVAISPDGTHLAYVANNRLYVRALNQAEAAPVPGTDAGGPGGFARAPIFSADGQWIAFWQQGQLRKVAVSGGAPVTICDLPVAPVGASWEPNGNILAGVGPLGIVQVPAAGGTPKPLIPVKNGEVAADPQGLPGDRWILFLLGTQFTSSEQGQVVVQSIATGERRLLINGARDVRYVPSGHIVFGRGNALLAQAFDAGRLTLSGSPVSVLDGIANAGSAPAMHVAFSKSGTLLYVPGSTNTATTRLVLVARDGTGSPLAEIVGMTWSPRFSPDGTRVAFGVSAGQDLSDASDLWVLDVARGARTRVTFTGNNRFNPIWTRDGTRLTFADSALISNRILWTLADGSGKPEVLLDGGPARRFPTSWSPDAHTLAYYVGGTGTGNSRDLWMLRVDGDKRTPIPFVETPFEERGAIFSPDGRWVAYVSDKSGQNDIYARPYPGPGGEVTISVGGGQEPVWAPLGRELFYRHDRKLMAVRIEERGPSLTVGAPTRVFDDLYRLDRAGSQGGVANYDLAPDGQRFVMVEEPKPTSGGASQTVRLQVMLNWIDELKRRVPTK